MQLKFFVENESYYSRCFRDNKAPQRTYELKIFTSWSDLDFDAHSLHYWGNQKKPEIKTLHKLADAQFRS